MIADKVGDQRLRAGLPRGWTIGDKTGSGDHGTANVIAVLRPPNRAPLIAAVYYTESDKPMEARNAVHKEIGALVAETFSWSTLPVKPFFVEGSRRKRGQGSLGKEVLGQHVLDRPGAGLRELAKLKRANGFALDRVTVSLAQDFPWIRAQRWAILDDALDPPPRFIDRGFPRRAPPFRLAAPLEQVDERFSSRDSISRLSLRPNDSISSARLS